MVPVDVETFHNEVLNSDLGLLPSDTTDSLLQLGTSYTSQAMLSPSLGNDNLGSLVSEVSFESLVEGQDSLFPFNEDFPFNEGLGSSISAELANDTDFDGGTKSDGITADPSIDGVLNMAEDESDEEINLWARLVEQKGSQEDNKDKDDSSFFDISNQLNQDGSFSLSRAAMERLNGGAISDGDYTLQLLAPSVGFESVDFTMNRVIYTVSSEDTRELVLVNTETDDLIKKDLDSIEGWQEAEQQMRSTQPRYFESELTPDQVVIPEGVDAPDPTGVDASGHLSMVLDPTGALFGKNGGPAVKYELELSGVDLGGTSTPETGDDVTGIHLHSGGLGESVIGPHTLNIFGAPSEDDDDVTYDFENNTISGIWDNSDATGESGSENTSDGVPDHHLSNPQSDINPTSTKTVSDYADEMLANNLYIQVHTNDYPSPGGVLRGQIDKVEGDGQYEASTEGYIENAFIEHTLITPDEQSIYLTANGSLQIANSIVALDLKSVDWEAGTAEMSVENTIIASKAGEPTKFPNVGKVDNSQPIQSWTTQAWNQLHGPTIRPGSPIIQFSQWTSDKLFFVDSRDQEPVEGGNPLTIEGVTNQSHGVFYNPSGTTAMSPGYYWDEYDIDVYEPGSKTGVPQYEESITLNSEDGKGPFQHFVSWANDHYAYAASMQYGSTSLTPEGTEIAGPGIWLIDSVERTAERVIGTAETANDSGVFRNPSDYIVVGDKLYVAEEDSLDDSFGNDGYLAIYDVSDLDNPNFIKRLKPGEELPSDFEIAHGLSPSSDGESVYMASYRSDYLVKVDTSTDTVARVWGPEDGLKDTHGGFAAGSLR